MSARLRVLTAEFWAINIENENKEQRDNKVFMVLAILDFLIVVNIHYNLINSFKLFHFLQRFDRIVIFPDFGIIGFDGDEFKIIFLYFFNGGRGG